MQKPYRFVADLVSSYADEAAAYLRRRRHRARAYARVWRRDGSIDAYSRAEAEARDLFAAAGAILDDPS